MASQGFKKGSSAQLAGAREQLLGDPMAHLGTQAAAGEVLAVRSPHHASISTNFFDPFRARGGALFDMVQTRSCEPIWSISVLDVG
jgi:hypothetical protein